MPFGKTNLDQVVNKVVEEKLKYQDTILIGDNSSGKSELLRRLIKKLENQNVYFIDSVNRTFSVQAISRTKEMPVYKEDIIKTRLDEEHFNIKDSFNFYGTRTERIEMIYNLFEKEVQELFGELTGITFELLPEIATGEVQFSEGRGLMSNGYQALIRILLELLYYQETHKDDHQKMWIIIDELDEFLSPRYAGKIWAFLKDKFRQFNFIITTHSCDLIANANNANLIVLTLNDFEIWDINDYNSNSSIQMIFDRVFGMREQKKDEIFNCLRNLFSKKINGVWSEYEERQFAEIDVSKLTASQTLIYKQIQEW